MFITFSHEPANGQYSQAGLHDPAHSLPSFLFNIYCNVILPIIPKDFKWSFPSHFPFKTWNAFLLSPTSTRICHPPWSDNLTNLQSPSWEPNRFSPHLMKPKSSHPCSKELTIILKIMNPLHILQPSSFKIHSSVILPWMPKSSMWSLASRFSHKNHARVSLLTLSF